MVDMHALNVLLEVFARFSVCRLSLCQCRKNLTLMSIISEDERENGGE